jgi:hypothetical protein
MSRDECYVLTNISAVVIVAIFTVNAWWREFCSPYVEEAAGSELDLTVLIGGAVERLDGFRTL